MKFYKFIKKYYEVSQINFPNSYSAEEIKILEKNIFQRKRYETVALLASERKKAIINSYIFLLIGIILLLTFTVVDIKFLWGLIPLIIFIILRFIKVDFSIINIFIYYLAYKNTNNVFKEILKENFNEITLIKDKNLNNIDNYYINYSFKKFSLFKLKYEIIIPNAYFVKIKITRNRIVLKTKIKKTIINDKKLNKEEVIKQIKEFIKDHTIDNAGRNFEWRILKKVRFTEKFEAYGFIISLDRCICENKEVGINIKNHYNIKKAVKYRFHIDCICYIILVKKINDDEYVIFKKQEIS